MNGLTHKILNNSKLYDYMKKSKNELYLRFIKRKREGIYHKKRRRTGNK